jgi:hypothetical protein
MKYQIAGAGWPVGARLIEAVDDNGAIIFLEARKMGLEGIVPKRLRRLIVNCEARGAPLRAQRAAIAGGR